MLAGRGSFSSTHPSPCTSIFIPPIMDIFIWSIRNGSLKDEISKTMCMGPTDKKSAHNYLPFLFRELSPEPPYISIGYDLCFEGSVYVKSFSNTSKHHPCLMMTMMMIRAATTKVLDDTDPSSVHYTIPLNSNHFRMGNHQPPACEQHVPSLAASGHQDQHSGVQQE
jgi:hypothetical protein